MQAEQGGATERELISDIATEFAEVFAFARSRWARFAEEIHPELRLSLIHI